MNSHRIVILPTTKNPYCVKIFNFLQIIFEVFYYFKNTNQELRVISRMIKLETSMV
jgi:hypothetical protein